MVFRWIFPELNDKKKRSKEVKEKRIIWRYPKCWESDPASCQLSLLFYNFFFWESHLCTTEDDVLTSGSTKNQVSLLKIVLQTVNCTFWKEPFFVNQTWWKVSNLWFHLHPIIGLDGTDKIGKVVVGSSSCTGNVSSLLFFCVEFRS